MHHITPFMARCPDPPLSLVGTISFVRDVQETHALVKEVKDLICVLLYLVLNVHLACIGKTDTSERNGVESIPLVWAPYTIIDTS